MSWRPLLQRQLERDGDCLVAVNAEETPKSQNAVPWEGDGDLSNLDMPASVLPSHKVA